MGEGKTRESRIPLQDNTINSPWPPWWFCWGRGRGSTAVGVLLARPQQSHQVREELLYILSRLCRRFQKPATKVAGHSGTFFSGHLAFVLLVAFIANEHEHRSVSLHLEHGLAEDLEALERCPRGNRVYEDESLTFSVIRWGQMSHVRRGREKDMGSHLTHWSRRVAYSSG